MSVVSSSTPTSDSGSIYQITKPIMKYSITFMFVIYFVAIFMMISRDPHSMEGNRRVLYLFSIIAPMIIFITMVLSNIDDQRYFALVVVMLFIILLLVCRSVMPFFDKMAQNFFGYLTNVTEQPPLSIEHSFLLSIVSKLLLVSIGVVFLSIVFSSFFHDSFRQRGKANIILHALFFIPCLVSDYVKYLLNEVKTTPTVVYILIIIEIILITLYFLVPKISQYLLQSNKRCIIRDPVYLDKKRTVSGMDKFYNNTEFYKELEKEFNVRGSLEMSNEEIPNKSLIRNYSISFWLTLNAPSLSKEDECMILRIGNDNGTISEPDTPRIGMPYIGFKEGKVVCVCSNNIYTKSEEVDNTKAESVSFEFEIPYQKWNNIVMNYRSNFVDVFLNGDLIKTVSLKHSLPKYNHGQTVCIGSDSGKLHGAICELCIYDKCLGRSKISQQYNLLNLKNPPVNNFT